MLESVLIFVFGLILMTAVKLLLKEPKTRLKKQVELVMPLQGLIILQKVQCQDQIFDYSNTTIGQELLCAVAYKASVVGEADGWSKTRAKRINPLNDSNTQNLEISSIVYADIGRSC